MNDNIPMIFYNDTYKNLSDSLLPKGVTDIDIINHYCRHYMHNLPYNSLIVIFTLTLIAVILYNRDHPNFIGFLKMEAFIIILLGIINIVILAIAL